MGLNMVRRRWRLGMALATSLVLHLLLLRLWGQRPPVAGRRLPPTSSAMLRSVPLDAAQQAAVQRARAARLRPAKPAQPVAKAPRPERLPHGQVVELPPAPASSTVQEDPSARFLAERASRVAKEQRAALGAAPLGAAALRAAAGAAGVDPPKPASAAPPRLADKAVGNPTKAATSPAKGPQTSEAVADPSVLRPQGMQQLPQPAATPTPALTMADLLPEVGALARLTGGGGGSLDALPQLQVGTETLLNAREFKYSSFFNRIKRGVAQHWRPLQSLAGGGRSSDWDGVQSRSTTLEVTLDRGGALTAARVLQSSGLEALDQAALDAFARAAPFAHPPTALCNELGELSFEFGFYLEAAR